MSARDELERIYGRDGFLTPEQVLAEASDATNPLHSHFEWDDSEAAARYRLDQARGLIRSCKITVEVSPEEVRRVRAYHSLPKDDGKPGYFATTDIMSDPAKRDVVLHQLQRDITALRAKYKHLIDVDAALRTIIDGEAAAA